VVNDDRMQGEVKITVIATGFGRKARTVAQQPAPVAEPVTQQKPEYQRPLVESRPVVYASDDEDLNIPAFLRNRRQ
jgi:cell division protein FtsZ